MNVDFTLASFLLTVLLVCNAKQWTVRERVHYLLAGYDSIGRPVQNATTPIQALIDVVLQQVVDLDEKNQVLVTSLLIQLKWRDEILSHKLQILRALIRRDWQPTDQTDSNGGGNLFDVDEISFVLPSDRIWTPDLYVYNNAADGNKGMLRVEESRLRVSECGEWSNIIRCSRCKTQHEYQNVLIYARMLCPDMRVCVCLRVDEDDDCEGSRFVDHKHVCFKNEEAHL